MVHNSLRRRPATLLALGALAVTSSALAVGASASTTTTVATYQSSCFAQLVSLSIGGTSVPLDAGRTCGNPGDSFVPTDKIAGPAQFPFVINVLYENTSRSGDQAHARARAGVAHVYLPLGVASGGQLPDITVDLLTSQSTCDNGTAASESHVVGLKIGDTQVELPTDVIGPDPIDLSPLATLAFNEGETHNDTVSDTGAGSNPRVVVTHGTTARTALHLVVLPGAAPGPADGIDLAVARTSATCDATTTTTTTGGGGGGGGGSAAGWMTGGGQVTGTNGGVPLLTTSVTHSLVLPCDAHQAHPRPHLNLVWSFAGTQHHFQLSGLNDDQACSTTGSGPGHPDAGFDTLSGSGVGTCDGTEGVPVRYTFTDSGEPGTADQAEIHVDGGSCKLDVAKGPVSNGNQQAHKGANPPA